MKNFIVPRWISRTLLAFTWFMLLSIAFSFLQDDIWLNQFQSISLLSLVLMFQYCINKIVDWWYDFDDIDCLKCWTTVCEYDNYCFECWTLIPLKNKNEK